MDYLFFSLPDKIYRLDHLDVLLLNLLAKSLIPRLQSAPQSKTLFLLLCKLSL